MGAHLTDATIEALAHDRPDLVDEDGRQHLATCAACAATVEGARALSAAMGPVLREHAPPTPDLRALIDEALARPPAAPALRRGAVVAGVLAFTAATCLAALSFHGLEGIPEALGFLRDGAAVFSALRRAVSMLVPGGVATVGMAGMVLLLGLGLALRSLTADPRTLRSAGEVAS